MDAGADASENTQVNTHLVRLMSRSCLQWRSRICFENADTRCFGGDGYIIARFRMVSSLNVDFSFAAVLHYVHLSSTPRESEVAHTSRSFFGGHFVDGVARLVRVQNWRYVLALSFSVIAC